MRRAAKLFCALGYLACYDPRMIEIFQDLDDALVEYTLEATKIALRRGETIVVEGGTIYTTLDVWHSVNQ